MKYILSVILLSSCTIFSAEYGHEDEHDLGLSNNSTVLFTALSFHRRPRVEPLVRAIVDEHTIEQQSREQFIEHLRELEIFLRHLYNEEIRGRQEPVQRETSVLIEKPKPRLQSYYHKNNNRVDRPKHAQINKRIHQPRKHNHEPRCNNRRNQ